MRAGDLSVLLLALLISGFASQVLRAQSAAVDIPANVAPYRPVERLGMATRSEPGLLESSISNSLDPIVIEFENRLTEATWSDVAGIVDGSYPNAVARRANGKSAKESMSGTLLFGQLIANLEQLLGIPVILDNSSDLKEETEVDLPRSAAAGSIRLIDAFPLLLRRFDSDMRLTAHGIEIFSIDELAEHLDRVVYDVSPIVEDGDRESVEDALNELVRLIQNTVEPESWEVEGPAISNLVSGNQKLMVVVNNYNIHRQIRRLFCDFDRLAIRANPSGGGSRGINPTRRSQRYEYFGSGNGGGQF
jgi:hypothetical protein